MKILHLHVPHTAGRCIRRFIANNCHGSRTVASSRDISNYHKSLALDENESTDITYWVLRNPIERVAAEYIHYSSTLKVLGEIGDLRLDILRRENPKFNLDIPSDYIQLERRRNVYCKFLLQREDFTLPISDSDYDHVVAMTKRDDIVVDFFEALDFSNLSRISKQPIDRIQKYSSNYDADWKSNYRTKRMKLLENSDLRKLIGEQNQYDCKLYEELVILNKFNSLSLN